MRNHQQASQCALAIITTKSRRMLGLIISLLIVILGRPGATTISSGTTLETQDSTTVSENRSNSWMAAALDAPDGSQDAVASAAMGYLLADWTDQRLNLSDPLDRNVSILLDLNGPDMRPSRDYNDYRNVSVAMSMRAWSLMHKHAVAAVRGKVTVAEPILTRLFVKAKTSRKCVNSIKATLEAAIRMESWAVKLLISWGHFPMSGLFEGTYGDVGSFQTCLDVSDAPTIGHAHYCSVTFRPMMASRQDYELVLRPEPRQLRELFEQGRESSTLSERRATNRSRTNGTNQDDAGRSFRVRDTFTELLEHAQYHHYVYYKWGTCWPIDCSPFDVKRIAKLVGRANILLNGPVKCYSTNEHDYEQEYDDLDISGYDEAGVSFQNDRLKTNGPGGPSVLRKRKLVISTWDKNGGIYVWKPHFYMIHKISLAIIISVTLLILLMTALDLFANKLPRLMSKLGLALKGQPLDQHNQTDSLRSISKRRTTSRLAVRGDDSRARVFCKPIDSLTPAPVRKHQNRTPAKPGRESSPATVDEFEQKNLNNLEAESAIVACKVETSDELRGELHITFDQDEPSPSRCFPLLMAFVDDCSIFTNLATFFRISEGQLRNDILCLNGIRCITMVWIIMTHTMMYNDWAQFGRTREVEKALKSLITQPLFNGSYLVDTFFLMSGLLSAFTAFKHCQGKRAKFNSLAYIFGRWLRLTPQIFFVSLLYIILPAMSHGPHWFPIVGEFSENCQNNWWINVLHLQAFYKKAEMCNFVTWWISIDFFYHLFALIAIWVIMLSGHRRGVTFMLFVVLSQVIWQSKQHYELGLPPNVLSTIPQTGAMWTKMTLDFFWTPSTHSVPFFLGFYIGYLMALKEKLIVRWLNTRRALIGWLLSVCLLLAQSYCTYWWIIGEATYSKWFSTTYYGACSFIWAGSLAWIIIACQYGYGGFINRALSCRAFIILGKASYLVYLSHFQVLFLFFANQNLIIEPTWVSMIYIICGNIFISTLWGILLCAVYEFPWLKMHRRLMKYV